MLSRQRGCETLIDELGVELDAYKRLQGTRTAGCDELDESKCLNSECPRRPEQSITRALSFVTIKTTCGA